MKNKLDNLRALLAQKNIDGFYIPRADEFQGEYVPECANRLFWATGFTGSAGSAIVLKDKAAFFTDGRYTIQAQDEVSKTDFEIFSTAKDQLPTPTLSPTEWIEKNLPKGGVFAIDPWLHTPDGEKAIRTAVEKAGGTLVYIDSNPIDAVWQNRPPQPMTPALPHPLQYAGVASKDKRDALSKILTDKKADALAITLPEEICWLLNVRGNDVPHTPFVLSYAIAHQDGTVDWYVDAAKIPTETKEWVGKDVRFHPLKDFSDALKNLGAQKKTVWIDPAAAPVIAATTLKDAGAGIHAEQSPLQLMKALKNNVEIAGTIKAHIRDGAALTRFLAAIANGGAKNFDEISASDLLEKYRREEALFRDLSFDTISGAGGNGAIVHYRSTPKTNQPLTAGPIYLLDSGGQYLDGTTDVTRTIAVGAVTPAMKEHVTRVLKGHIQVAMAAFPEGTTGDKLDILARAALKEVGLDFAHGTGHGVGSYLSVHEGPCGISPRATTVPLMPGMIISNEPGYYKEGAYGIRIENLVTVIDTGKKDTDGKKLLGFKTLTMAPIDRHLIEPSLLTDAELAWLNSYHAEVQKNLLPLLEKKDPRAAAFLKEATAPIQRTPPPRKIKMLAL